MLVVVGSSNGPAPARASEPEPAPEPIAGLVVALRDRARRVLLGELDRSLRRRLRHLTPEERDALRTMIETAIDQLMREPATRLTASAARPEALADAALVRALFGLGRAGRREAA